MSVSLVEQPSRIGCNKTKILIAVDNTHLRVASKPPHGFTMQRRHIGVREVPYRHFLNDISPELLQIRPYNSIVKTNAQWIP